jgi:oligopeptide/dipeptide ABC transporter ATP-binding protein
VTDEALLDVRDLRRYFGSVGGSARRSAGVVRAVDGVNLEIERGEAFGLVGESGAGKSTLARTILRLDRASGGSAIFRSLRLASPGGPPLRLDLFTASRSQWRVLRREIQMVFQDAEMALNPRKSVRAIVAEPLRIHRLVPSRSLSRTVDELLRSVGLGAELLRRYPGQLSGGQRQRVGIARALAVSPRFVACDEPVASFDASIQAEILNLLQDLRELRGLTYLLIAHDLSVVRSVCERVAIMLGGRIVESATAAALFARPLHPYTARLLWAVPRIGVRYDRKRTENEQPLADRPIAGCRYSAGCPHAQEVCREAEPELRTVDQGRSVACHLAERLTLRSPFGGS